MRFNRVSSQNLVKHFAKTNDFDALMALYNRHHDQLLVWVRSNFKVDNGIAEYVVVATFERVRDRAKKYNARKPFLDWLVKLAAGCVPVVKASIGYKRKRVRAVSAILDLAIVA